MQNGDERQRKMQRVMQIVVDEAMEELTADSDQLVLWLLYTARITEWIATGNMNILPDELLPFACSVEGLDYNQIIAARNQMREQQDQLVAIDTSEVIEAEVVS